MTKDKITPSNLNEVSLMRPILVVLLVMYHAFAPWRQRWQQPYGFESCKEYQWIADFAFSFMLPAFVFTSGYIFAFQRIRLGRISTFKELFIKKAKRLYLPCLLFGTLFTITFRESIFNAEAVIDIFRGTGHLWFLAMLFECFVIYFALLKFIKNQNVITTIVICTLFLLLLGIVKNQFFFYLFFFHLGYILFEPISKRTITIQHVIVSWIVYLFLFLNITHVCNILTNEYYKSFPEITYYTFYLSVLLTGISGTLGLLTSAIYFTKRITLHSSVVKFGASCFGIYIFQEFVLRFLYYYSPLPYHVSNQLLPWISFVIALLISYAFTKLLHKSRIGRQLI